jgi:broad-specificity NMP kinase
MPLYEIDTSNISIKSVAKIIIEIVIGNNNGVKYLIGKIDWLEKLFQEDRLAEFFD